MPTTPHASPATASPLVREPDADALLLKFVIALSPRRVRLPCAPLCPAFRRTDGMRTNTFGRGLPGLCRGAARLRPHVSRSRRFDLPEKRYAEGLVLARLVRVFEGTGVNLCGLCDRL
ncbi:hypothetical protein GCM10010220_35230 [Streptomyces parvulus]|nr:hypothetical protein GCM10010220_35230 [Streptomyces parvulus]